MRACFCFRFWLFHAKYGYCRYIVLVLIFRLLPSFLHSLDFRCDVAHILCKGKRGKCECECSNNKNNKKLNK